MSEELKKTFVDRVATNINRKKLEIKEIKLDEEGEIVELVVDVIRLDDANISGTLLNEENLKEILIEMIEEKLGVKNNE